MSPMVRSPIGVACAPARDPMRRRTGTSRTTYLTFAVAITVTITVA